MPRRTNRVRRPVSQTQIKIVRAIGWRYSANREAWVLRPFGGRFGPVFALRPDEEPENGGVPDLHLFEAMTRPRRPRVLPEDQRPPLPRRIEATEPSEPRPVYQVETRLRGDEPPRVVVVDGRPPERGVDPRALRPADGVVVPIRKVRTA